jgi:hypothetical protein
VRRTLNEVHRICQKAAEGAGAPAGVDVDAAEGAVWLAAHGLHALAGLTTELEGLAGGTADCGFGTNAGADGLGILDAADKAGSLVAPGLVDLLVARVVGHGRAGRLQATGLSVPLFLLPPAARYAEDGWHFWFVLTGPDGGRFALEVSPGQGATIMGPAGVESAAAMLGDTGGFNLEAACARSADDLPETGEEGLAVLADPGALEAAAARSLAEGLMVAPELWARLQALAAEVLVAATEESRRRGAGELGSANN